MEKDSSDAHRSLWIILVPVLLYIILIILFYWLNIETIFQSQPLLLALNVLFIITSSFLIVYLATVSYVKTGSGSLLFLGCGALVFALVNLLGGILITNSNIALTVSNTGYLLTGLCFLVSALLAYTRKPRSMRSPAALSTISLAYVILVISIGLLYLGAWAGITPAFYTSGQGSTLLRQIVLDITTIEFVLASVCFGILYRQSRTRFLIWYSLGLLLIGLCMVTLVISGAIWTPLAWIARLGIYLGGLYLFIAIWSISESGSDRRIPLESALYEIEEKYRNIVETATEGIWISDIDGMTTFVNKRMAEMLGHSPEEMMGKSAYDFMDEDARALARQNHERRRQGIRECFEQKYIRKDGSTLWAIVSGTPLLDKNGKINAFMGMLTDITERKHAEEERERLLKEIDEQKARLEAIIAALPVGLFILDIDGGILVSNEMASRIWGGEAPIVKQTDEYHVYRAWWADTGKPMENEERVTIRALKGETLVGVMCDIQRFDGTRGTILNSAAPIRDSAGNIIGAVSIIQDITDIKEMERDLREAKLQAELYLDLMGHDISNMHHIAMGQLELANEIMDEDGGLKVEEHEQITTPLETLKRSARLIENVRKLQKVKSGEFKDEIIDLDELLSNVVAEYGFMVPSNSITYIGNGPGHVMANKLLHDVFGNLIGNAIKYSGGNDIDINVDLEKFSENSKNYYKVLVEDTGPGIPDELKDKVFNRLQRGETKTRGLGLGLYLVKSLVDSYHGRVWVEDRVVGDYTKGSRFVVLLPAMEDPDGN